MRVRIGLLFALVAFAAGCGDEITNVTNVTEVLPDSAPPSGSIIALTNSNVVFWVNPANPSVILGAQPILGLPSNDTLITLAFRPATGQLYARARNGFLFVIHVTEGVVTQAGGFGVIFPATSTIFSAAFSTGADVMRLVTNDHFNVRFNPVTAAVTVDDSLGTAFLIRGIAYAAGPTLYGLDLTNVQLVRIGGVNGLPSPNLGAVTPIGPLGLTPGVSAFTGGFTISATGQAYAAFQDGLEASTRLFTVNLTTGAATQVGLLGTGGPTRAIAVVP